MMGRGLLTKIRAAKRTDWGNCSEGQVVTPYSLSVYIEDHGGRPAYRAHQSD